MKTYSVFFSYGWLRMCDTAYLASFVSNRMVFEYVHQTERSGSTIFCSKLYETSANCDLRQRLLTDVCGIKRI